MELTAAIRELKRIVLIRASPSLLTPFPQAKFRNGAVQESKESLEAARESDIEGSASEFTNRQNIEPKINLPDFDQFIAQILRNKMQKKAQQNAKDTFEELLCSSMHMTA